MSKDWATPAGAGLGSLGIVMFMYYALFAGKVDTKIIPLLGIWVIGTAIVQLVVGLVELKNGSVLGGNIFLLFGGISLWAGGTELVYKYTMALNHIAFASNIDGWVFLAFSLILILWVPGFYKGATTVSIALTAVTLAFIMVTFHDFGMASEGLVMAGAYCFLISGIFAIYSCGAIVLNSEYGKTVLPMGPAWIKVKE
jgi:succinate-acetate transporter protein